MLCSTTAENRLIEVEDSEEYGNTWDEEYGNTRGTMYIVICGDDIYGNNT